MLKKHVLGGALFLTSLFILSSCGEMSSWDNPVSSYLEVNDDAPVIGFSENYTITKGKDYSTISDVAPEFTIAEESKGIAEVDNTTGVVTPLKCGDAKIVISIAKNDYYLAAIDTFTVKVRVKNTVQFVKAVENIDATAEENNILLAAAADIDLTSVDAISINFDGNVAIKGEESKPAKITLAKSFVIYDNFTLENVDVDASGVSGALFQLASSPTAAFLPKNDGSGDTDWYGIDNITLKNSKITGVKGSILYDNNKKYCVVALTFDDCQFDLQTESVDNAAIVSFKGGGVKDLTIKNSTFSGNDAVGRYFVRYNNSARIDRFGFVKAEDTWSFTYINNTFYNLLLDVAPNDDKAEWGNYGGMCGNGKEKLGVITVNNNIWYNCDSQTMRRMLSSKNFSAFKAGSTMANNTFWFSGAAVDQGNYGNGSDLTTDPNFKDPAKGDFTPQGTDQKSKKTGDPRWWK